MEPTDEQLARWLESPSQDDIQDLNEWLDKSPENLQKWESYQMLWQNSAKLASRIPLPDRERIWSGIEAEIGEKKTFTIPAFFKYAAAAAVIPDDFCIRLAFDFIQAGTLHREQRAFGNLAVRQFPRSLERGG
jgi:ferric-dicitrate binding protein FerR (iron transport regulator)